MAWTTSGREKGKVYNMARFFTADWHIYEERMAILGRPFATGEECVEAMIANHNKVVAPDDEVIVVGDVCYQKRLDCLPLVARFNGVKTLIRGNHDRGLSDADLAPYFVRVVPDGAGIYRKADGVECYITHYPTRGRPGSFNLVGHIHSAWKVQTNMLNVGVDVHHFFPVPEEKIFFYYKAICDFYDEDVWVAYNAINAKLVGSRGKKGTYFIGKDT